MSNSNQKIYTLALGKCTGEFTIAYDFSGQPQRGGSLTISEHSESGIVSNTFFESSGTRTTQLSSNTGNLIVSFTNNFSYPISASVDLCSSGVQTSTLQPGETKSFIKDFGVCNYTATWIPASGQNIKTMNAVAGSIEITWDDLSLNSGDTTGAGSLTLLKDSESPETGTLTITAPPGAVWSVYLDCTFCGGESDSDSYPVSELDSDSDSYLDSDQIIDSESDSDNCCNIQAPEDAGVVLNPYEYMSFWKACTGDLDINMAPVCENSGDQNPTNCDLLCEQEFGVGWCGGELLPGSCECIPCVPNKSSDPEQNIVRRISNVSNRSSNCVGDCLGGDPLGSRIHIADITPAQAEQYWQDLINSCQGNAYGPFPLMARNSCSFEALGQEPSGTDLGGSDVQEYIGRKRKSYCPVDQEPKWGPVYMIGSDGNCGCALIPMKYVICNGCYVGLLGISCDQNQDYSDGCPDSDSEDSDSESDLPFEIPPPALPPEQPIGGAGAIVRFNFNPFNPPPIGQAGGGALQGGQQRDINLKVGKKPPQNQKEISSQAILTDCHRTNGMFTFVGVIEESSFKIDNAEIELFINGRQRALLKIDLPWVGQLIDFTVDLLLSKFDNGSYTWKCTFNPDQDSCAGAQVVNVPGGNITVIEERVFTSYKTCEGEIKQVETYCNGTLAEPIPDVVNGKQVCYLSQAIINISNTNNYEILDNVQLINDCGDIVNATLTKKEHNQTSPTGSTPSGCGNYNLTYHLMSTEYRSNDIPLTLSLPTKNSVKIYTSENSESIVLKGDPEIYSIELGDQITCSPYMPLTTTLPPPPPTQEDIEPEKVMILDQMGMLLYETTVGTTDDDEGGLNIKFSPGTSFWDEDGNQITEDFVFGVKKSIGVGAPYANQFGLQNGGGWYFDGEGALFAIATWDHGGVTCKGKKVADWSIPGEFTFNPGDQDLAQAVASGGVDIFRLNRSAVNRGGSQGEWETIGGLTVDPATGKLKSEISYASTWNIDTRVSDVCGLLLVYPPSELLKSRKVTDLGPIITIGQVAPGTNTMDFMDELKKHRLFETSPGIGIRFRALNSNVFQGQIIDTIIRGWPQVFINWPKNDPVTGRTIKYKFEFYDTTKTGIARESNEVKIMSGIPAPPGDPNAPAICTAYYENPTPGITSLCVLNTCGDDNPCKMKKIQQELKGSVDGTLGGAE